MSQLPVTTVDFSGDISRGIAGAQVSDDDFDEEDALGLAALRRLRGNSESMRVLEPMVKQIVDQITTKVRDLTGCDPGEPTVRVFDFIRGSMISSSPTFILALPRRKDPERAPKLPMVVFAESGTIIKVRFWGFCEAECRGYLLKSGITMSVKEVVSVMMVRFDHVETSIASRVEADNRG
ncbi:hypothetical protein B0T16DRAFT_497649 [Cercophora newfieldiana]|uniref:Uncharacterized protein n=1 Tax=Cercophora newfieldiana TaxID=92897 RepID=A0AA39XUD2_9PEZI|nr:hypothetical protein B0T16DRAFT_497649 [Cercophora newfieldiana]